MIEITREIAAKVRDVVDAGLVQGVGVAEPGKMCVEAAVCYAMGLPHGDDPACVSRALRRLKIGLNDCNWSSTAARAKGLRRLAVAQLGSRDAVDDVAFMRRVSEMTIRKAVPIALRAAAKKNPNFADQLEAAAVRCEKEGTRAAAQHGERVARDAAASAIATAATVAFAAATATATATTATTAAAAAGSTHIAASALDAADDAYAAAFAAATAAGSAAYDDVAANADEAARAWGRAARDRVLAQYAEWVVAILIEMNAPGCQWLDLVPVDERKE